MFINKIFKNKVNNTEIEQPKEACRLKTCPLYVNNIEELLQISSDEYILKENRTLVRVDEGIYIYKNGRFELLKEPLSTIAKRNVNRELESKIINYIDEIRTLIINDSLNTMGYISLLNYNFSIDDIINYGFDKFVEILQSDGSNFEVTQENCTIYGHYGQITKVDIKIKWM